ncbi:MAG: bifunctional phosphoribosylaminoimidazolecarboxamide formyltransferase/IMP cyclohydrolase [Bacillota bacterium]|nr:bifunctional phosphoribosylaminoimidazolecarboxamide formyltransferase/IMP cyclohydrolase [Bacillota bacterium]
MREDGQGVRPVRRALVSVYDKTGVEQLAEGLVACGAELISTGGTCDRLRRAGLPVVPVEEVTGFPEMLDGRVKTLHPRIHGGILADRSLPSHLAQIAQAGIAPIDLVVVNLYPFAATVARPGVSRAEAIEQIDIGGPSLIRAAAKNHAGVAVVTDPAQYGEVLAQIREFGGTTLELRRRLAAEAFAVTARYDAQIYRYLADDEPFPAHLFLHFTRQQALRYGENPHQRAAFYRDDRPVGRSLVHAVQLGGKELSYNNLNDADAALSAVAEFAGPAAVAVKHTNPCGVAEAETLAEAFRQAAAADPVSIFGGIVALNREVDEETARELAGIFLEVITAPGFSPGALSILQAKKNLRLLQVPQEGETERLDLRRVAGGLLVQDADVALLPPEEGLKVVTSRAPSPEQWEELRFAWKVVKHVKSNAIVVARGRRTLGIGGGQVNRIDPARYALQRAGEAARGAVLASDAFFPMPDVVEAAAAAGIAAIIQPGGSIRDAESIAAAESAGIAMVFTGLRHFKH